ncbi:MAG: LLM class flavin-dependent oxidoreductase [Solirubrobacterales bacterium]|nr:LLM class flavin-dependent oxidoreductase [Solirubrobacterales bacterium]MBV9714218.1 LLM class flavin-dependent oxidoreductase [Solirubrobacterales bacterium]
MQFGVTDHIDLSGVAPAALVRQRLELVELYERLGFDRYMVTEHHGTPLNLFPSPHLWLAAASQRTHRIRLGTLVSLLPLYHPVRLLEEIGELDLLTSGRLELGIGRGVSPPEIATYGIDPADTPAMFAEMYEILLRGLSSEVLNHEGRFYSIADVLMVVPTVQKPRPPLWYGVGSGERAEWCARNGINMMSLLPPDRVRPLTDRFLAAWEETGRPEHERPLRGVNRNLVIAEDGEEARRVAGDAYVAFRQRLMFLWERSGVPAPPVFPPTFAQWQAVGGAFAGDPEEARQYVAEQVELAGLDTMSFHLAFGDLSFENVNRTAELFAAEVMPAFAEVGAKS